MAKAVHACCLPFVAALTVAAIIPAQSQSNSPTGAEVALCASAQAEPNSRCDTIVINYVGKIDSPVFPIIISSSPEEAERYRQKLFSDTDLIGGHVYIVRESAVKKIAEIPLPASDMKLPNSSDGGKTWPALRIVLARGQDSKEVIVDAAGSALLLHKIKNCVSEYPPLVEWLADVESRMERYRFDQSPG